MGKDTRCICFTYSSSFRLPISSCNTTTISSSSATDPVAPPEGASIPQRPAQPARALSVVRVRELEVRAGARSAALRATEASEQLEAFSTTPAGTGTVDALTSLIATLQRELRTLRKLSDPRLDNEIENIENLSAQADDLLKVAQAAQKEEEEAEESGLDGETKKNIDETDASGENNLPDTVKIVSKSNTPDAKPAVAEKIAHGVRSSVVRGGSELKRRAESVRSGVGTTVSQFVRDDGTIDLKVLREILSGRLDSAGTIWSRLNGRAEEELERRTEEKGSMSNFVPISTEEEQFRLRELISELERDLMTESKKREANLRKEDQLGKLIRAKEIRAMDDNVNAVRRTLAVRVLQLEMEKIYVALTEEFERGLISMNIDSSDKGYKGNNSNEAAFVITEFGELDSKLLDLSDYIDQREPLLVADDTLGEVANDIQYLKTRLGLDATLYTSSTLDWLQVRQIFMVSLKKTRTGLEFYARGFRLFTGDLVYAGKLVKRVIWGYIPTPREVRTIRRTGRDLLTLIPFTIILIAPLTPVGHVLVFSFIQRNWPEFFPSTFSERRQGLMKRYENYAEARRDETKDGGEENVEAEDTTTTKKRGGVIGRVVFVWRWIINAEGVRSQKEGTTETEATTTNFETGSIDNDVNNSTGSSSSLGATDTATVSSTDDNLESVQQKVTVIGDAESAGSDSGKSFGGGSGDANSSRRIRKGDSKSLGIDDLHLAD